MTNNETLGRDIAVGLVDDLELNPERIYEAIQEGVSNAMWRMITSGTMMPGADFYEFVRKGVSDGIERAAARGDIAPNALSSAAAVGGRLRRIVSPNGLIYLHHCCSHGTPSLFPSIFVPGQFLRKKVASSQEVI